MRNKDLDFTKTTIQSVPRKLSYIPSSLSLQWTPSFKMLGPDFEFMEGILPKRGKRHWAMGISPAHFFAMGHGARTNETHGIVFRKVLANPCSAVGDHDTYKTVSALIGSSSPPVLSYKF